MTVSQVGGGGILGRLGAPYGAYYEPEERDGRKEHERPLLDEQPSCRILERGGYGEEDKAEDQRAAGEGEQPGGS